MARRITNQILIRFDSCHSWPRFLSFLFFIAWRLSALAFIHLFFRVTRALDVAQAAPPSPKSKPSDKRSESPRRWIARVAAKWRRSTWRRSRDKGTAPLSAGSCPRDQAVRKMVRVPDERTFAPAHADDAHHHQIVQRQGQNDHRCKHRIPAGARTAQAREMSSAVNTPRMNPITSDPLSPMKIFAGGKFQQRNPSNAPSRSASEAATNHCWMMSVVTRNAVAHRCHAGTQAVHVVQKVECVGDRDDPERGEDDRNGRAQRGERHRISLNDPASAAATRS